MGKNGRWVGTCGGGRGVFGVGGRAPGRAEGSQGLPGPALIEVVLRNGLGAGGVKVWGLIEVVGERRLGDLFGFATAEADVEFDLGRSPGRMVQRG